MYNTTVTGIQYLSAAIGQLNLRAFMTLFMLTIVLTIIICLLYITTDLIIVGLARITDLYIIMKKSASRVPGVAFAQRSQTGQKPKINNLNITGNKKSDESKASQRAMKTMTMFFKAARIIFFVMSCLVGDLLLMTAFLLAYAFELVDLSKEGSAPPATGENIQRVVTAV